MSSRALPLLLCLILAVGCAVNKAYSPEVGQNLAGNAEFDRAVIRSGSLELRAKDLSSIKAEVEDLIRDVEGFVEEWSLTDDSWLRMTLRVPEPDLDSTMDRVAALGKVVSRSLSSRDVTEQMIDLEARLKNLKALRERLRAYLDQASNLEEILAVEKELARVQTEIEQIEAKLKVLRHEVTMSKLVLEARKKRFL